MHLLDILVHQRLYCSPYQDLNDPFEGQFKTLVRSLELSLDEPIGDQSLRVPGVATLNLNRPIGKVRYKQLEDLGIDEPKICSLSAKYSDVRMWSLYADSHQGVAIEIDFTGMHGGYHEVKYVDSLPKFGSTLLTRPSAIDVLTCKTAHWRYEEEHRILSEESYFSVAGRIRRVLIGIRTSQAIRGLLTKLLPQDVQLVQTRLDFDGTTVEIGDLIEREA